MLGEACPSPVFPRVCFLHLGFHFAEGVVERHRWLHRHGREHGASVITCLNHAAFLVSLFEGLHLEAVGDEHLVQVDVVGLHVRLLLAHGHPPPQPASQEDVHQRALHLFLHLEGSVPQCCPCDGSTIDENRSSTIIAGGGRRDTARDTRAARDTSSLGG